MGKFFFGLELHADCDADTVLTEIELGEKLGYDAIWLGDSQSIWREVYVLLGAAAKVTSRVRLGTGITNPVTRLPAVTASAITTLQELSGGRAVLGVARGGSSVRTLGMKPATLAKLGQFVNQVRELCSGGPTVAPRSALGLSFGAPQKCPPIIVAASGPKTLQLAGRIADGVIISAGTPSSGFQKAMGCIEAGLKERTLPKDNFQIIFMRDAAIHADRKKALAAVRPHVARNLLIYPDVSEAATLAKKKLQAAYKNNEHMSPDGDLVPDELITDFAIAGTAADCQKQAIQLFEQGVDQLAIRLYGVDGAPRSVAIKAFANEVMEPLRSNT